VWIHTQKTNIHSNKKDIHWMSFLFCKTPIYQTLKAIGISLNQIGRGDSHKLIAFIDKLRLHLLLIEVPL
jgi:hypothetical protein